MGVTPDNAANLSGALTSGVVTSSFTVGSGSNRLLLVCVSYATNSSNRVSSVTYNGTGLTSLIVTTIGGVNKLVQEVWYLRAPPTGTANVVVNLNATGVSIMGVGAISLADANQSAPGLGTSTAQLASGSSATSISCASSSSDDYMVEFGFVNFTSALGASVSSPTVITTTAYNGAAENPATGGAQAAGPTVMASQGTYPGGATSPGWTTAPGGGTFGYILQTVAIAAFTTTTLNFSTLNFAVTDNTEVGVPQLNLGSLSYGLTLNDITGAGTQNWGFPTYGVTLNSMTFDTGAIAGPTLRTRGFKYDFGQRRR